MLSSSGFPGCILMMLLVVYLQSHPDEDKRKEMFDKQAAMLPSKTLGTAEEVARIIIAIASSPFTTGSIFHVNGGKSKLQTKTARHCQPLPILASIMGCPYASHATKQQAQAKYNNLTQVQALR